MNDFGDLQEGQHIELLCQGCFKVWFPWELPKAWEACVPAYHSRRCQERRRVTRKKSTVYPKCPNPDKVLYRSHRDATPASIALCVRYRQPFSVYTCACGGLHIGRIPYRRRRRA